MYDDDDDVPKSRPLNFSPEEDEHLKQLLVDQKLKNWVKIASLMPGRNVHQCRERWRQISSKRGSDCEWTHEEDEIIMSKYCLFGRKWKEMQPFVPKHNISQVKARVTYLLKQKNVEYVPPKFEISPAAVEPGAITETRRGSIRSPVKEEKREQYVEEKPASSPKPVEVLEKQASNKAASMSFVDEPNFLDQDDLGLNFFQNQNPFENFDFDL